MEQPFPPTSSSQLSEKAPQSSPPSRARPKDPFSSKLELQQSLIPNSQRSKTQLRQTTSCNNDKSDKPRNSKQRDNQWPPLELPDLIGFTIFWLVTWFLLKKTTATSSFRQAQHHCYPLFSGEFQPILLLFPLLFLDLFVLDLTGDLSTMQILCLYLHWFLLYISCYILLLFVCFHVLANYIWLSDLVIVY